MKLSLQSQNSIEEAIKKTLANYPAGEEHQAITDIHLQPKTDSGILYIWDDDDKELANAYIEEWAEYDGENFYEEVEVSLRSILKRLREKGILDETSLMKPYSWALVDDDKETVSELPLVDDDTLLLNDDDLLKGLDEELDAFLKDLLEK